MRQRAVIITIAGAVLVIVGLAVVGTGLFALGRTPDDNFRFLLGLAMAALGGVMIYLGPGLGVRHDDS